MKSNSPQSASPGIAFQLDGFARAAMQFCREHDLNGPIDFKAIETKLRRDAFMLSVEPINKMICRIYSLAMPVIVMHKDGRIERQGDGLSPELRGQVSGLQKMIDDIAVIHGLTTQNSVTNDSFLPDANKKATG